MTYNFNSSKNDISNGSNSNNNLENQVEDESDFNDEEASNNNTSFDFFNTYLFKTMIITIQMIPLLKMIIVERIGKILNKAIEIWIHYHLINETN